mmetsp:Transcript_11395/g.26832  ORF Transcript_11395/g.26832 Transcript_11395/m.26832 type:complete len:279 (+) Transcript_11395:322-1158(+)|eukprot:CAMPEP_0185806970 /NCGR_PEP_ID=MMETSP1322-20130828/4737_1 /TAXON_ID=265543 /ORGANISM="Minutocellus polymorphus, Strain RCC2270" /LENGTH=278 /DNA_ID=CAMNT_0028503077 /DNA_START=274 /DNA_END=1110 /DNA_ORIENTATION=-
MSLERGGFVNRGRVMSDGLAWVGGDLGFAVGVQINNAGIAAAQNDDGIIHGIHVRCNVSLLLHVGVLEADLGYGRGITEGFVNEVEDGLGVVLSDGIDELFTRKLVGCKALGGEVAIGSKNLLMMGGVGVEVIEGVLLLAHLQKTLDSILGDDAVFLVEGALGIAADRFDNLVSRAAVIVFEPSCSDPAFLVTFTTLHALWALRALRALGRLEPTRRDLLLHAPAGIDFGGGAKEEEERGGDGEIHGGWMVVIGNGNWICEWDVNADGSSQASQGRKH